jgi:hypothetical protein
LIYRNCICGQEVHVLRVFRNELDKRKQIHALAFPGALGADTCEFRRGRGNRGAHDHQGHIVGRCLFRGCREVLGGEALTLDALRGFKAHLLFPALLCLFVLVGQHLALVAALRVFHGGQRGAEKVVDVLDLRVQGRYVDLAQLFQGGIRGLRVAQFLGGNLGHACAVDNHAVGCGQESGGATFKLVLRWQVNRDDSWRCGGYFSVHDDFLLCGVFVTPVF